MQTFFKWILSCVRQMRLLHLSWEFAESNHFAFQHCLNPLHPSSIPHRRRINGRPIWMVTFENGNGISYLSQRQGILIFRLALILMGTIFSLALWLYPCGPI
jgi:hypothetical protein